MTQWYYHSGGEQLGPYDEAEMIRLAKEGKVRPSDNVWNSTMGDNWVPASTVPAFFPPGPQSDAPAASAQSPAAQYFSVSAESQRARESDKKRMPKALVPAVIALVIGGAIFGMRQFGGSASRGARIDSMVAAGGIHLGSGARIWVHLEFTKVPEAGDAKDVKIVLSSDCFKNDMTFDWATIAANPTVPVSEGSLRRKRAEGVSPGKPPRLDYVFGVSFPLPISNMEAIMETDSKLQARAELYWAGEKMHSRKCSVRNWYVRK